MSGRENAENAENNWHASQDVRYRVDSVQASYCITCLLSALSLCALVLPFPLLLLTPNTPILSRTQMALRCYHLLALLVVALAIGVSCQGFGRAGIPLNRPPNLNPGGMDYVPGFGFLVSSLTYGKYVAKHTHTHTHRERERERTRFCLSGRCRRISASLG
jgi:hypothetical protein